MIKTVRNLVLIFVIVVMLGFGSMVASYMIPTESAHNMIEHDAAFITDRYNVVPEYLTTDVDMYSDTIILSEVSYYNKSDSLVGNAMSVYGIREISDFQDYVHGDESKITEYARYWHGNLVFLKPLFLFFDYNAIKILELFFELVMVISILKLMIDKNLKNYCIPFLLSLFFIHPTVIGLCFHLSSIFNLTLIAIWVLLKYTEVLLTKNRMLYYFLVVGMLTNFIDLSSFPFISFGVPVIFYLLLERDKLTIKNSILKIILFGVIWSLGYFGMWVSKWVIATMFLDFNVVTNAINQLFFRVSDQGSTRLDGIVANLILYKKRVYIAIMGLIIIYYAKKLFNVRKNITKNSIKQAIPFIFIAITPLVWYALLTNHSVTHACFAYRNLLILIMSLLCCLEYFVEKYTSN